MDSPISSSSQLDNADDLGSAAGVMARHVDARVPASAADAHHLTYAMNAMLRPFALTCGMCQGGRDGAVEVGWPGGRACDALVVDTAWLRDAFSAISGQRELGLPRDFLGRVMFSPHAAGSARAAYSEWGMEAASWLAGKDRRWRIPPRRLRVHLTHDVDRVNPYEPLGLARRLLVAAGDAPDTMAGRWHDFRRWVAGSRRFAETYETVMRAERDAGAVATYFFMTGPYRLGRVGSRCGLCTRSERARFLRDMADRHGHRIGLHGCAHSLARDDYGRQNRLLSQAAGRPITWHRSHYLVWDAARSPSRLAGAGIRVDSTCGFEDAHGFRAGLAWPYELWDSDSDGPSGVLEIPMVFMDVAVLNDAWEPAWEELYGILRVAESVGGEVAVNFHVDRFIGRADRVDRYRGLLEWLAGRGADLAANVAV